MAKFKTNVKPITEEGDYRFKINEVTEVTTKKGKEKIVLDAKPYDLQSDKEYADVQIWFDAVPGDREYSLMDALDNPEDLDNCKGMYVGGRVSFYEADTEDGTKTYTNVNDFFPVDQEPFLDATELPF